MRVLLVDDESHIRSSLKKYLSLEQITAETAETAEAALEVLEQEAFDAAVVDLKLPGMSGQELLVRLRRQGFSLPVIMISAHGQIADAVQALKTGAQDYLVKPFDPMELSIKLQSLVENKRREDRLETGRRTSPPEGRLIGESETMRRLSAQLDKLAAADVTILITGASGTGKEAVAREVHRRGPSREEPFAAVNIGGIHEGLMESELFGHEKGAFTGAASRRTGLFELAGRGTLFLDEIGEMPLALQVKLLRVLQDRKIRRLGGGVDIPVNARIISATNRDLERLIQEGRFREDLYYRLNVFRIELPPLRRRREDIPLLAEHLLRKLCARIGRSAYTLSAGALDALTGYSFPGNIRELENILERALIYRDGPVIEAADLDLRQAADQEKAGEADAEDAGRSGGLSLEELERRAVRESLERNGNNHTKAAAELGVSRKTLLNKIRAYRL
jgi:two-component system response regulator AtoC